MVTIVGYSLQGAWLVTTDYVINDAVTNGGETYICIQDHTAAAANEPGVGVDWEDYWVLIDYIASDAFGYYPAVGGILHMPAAWTAADIAFLVSANPGGPFSPLYDGAGNLIIIDSPLVGVAYVLPDELTGAHYVKLWSNTTGSNEAQGGNRSFGLDLKSS